MLFPDAPSFEHLADLQITFEPARDFGAGPHGRRVVSIISGGAVEGPALRGRVRPGGGDWALRHADGTRELDARATLELGDGALVYCSFTGTAAGDGALRAVVRFEAGDERCAWLNGVVCAGTGRLDAGALDLRVFAVRQEPAMPDASEAIAAEHVLDAHIRLAAPERIGAGPFGMRTVFIVEGGTFEGPRLRGEVLPGGGDWLLSSPGHNELDVRGTMRTDDGALLHLYYRGILRVPDDAGARVMAGEDVDPSTYYFRTAPRFETGSETYGWLNATVCVACGYFGPGRVGYRVFALR